MYIVCDAEQIGVTIKKVLCILWTANKRPTHPHIVISHTHTHTLRRIKDLGLSREHKPLYLTVDNKTVVKETLTLKEVYSTSWHGGEDKYLYIAYSSKDITDPDKS